MYYTFDPSFGNYFGSNGEFAVQQAFDILNSLTNVDSYSANLSEFPLNSQSENYTAYGLGLLDVKSFTLTMLMEQLGLTDAIRYTWTLHDRDTLSGGMHCSLPRCCLDLPGCHEKFRLLPHPTWLQFARLGSVLALCQWRILFLLHYRKLR